VIRQWLVAGLATWLVIAAVVVLCLAGCNHKARITEDDPRWNCTTMGNHICGGAR